MAESDLRHAILEAVDIEIGVVSPDGVMLYANAAWQRGFASGAQAPMATGGNFLERLTQSAHTDATADALVTGVRTVITGACDHFETEFARATEEGTRWLLMRVTPLHAAAPRAVVVTSLDITHIRQVTEGVLSQEYDIVRREQQQREVSSLEVMATPPSSAVTAAVYGKLPIRESAVAAFGVLVSRYGQLLERAVEHRIYRDDRQQNAELQELAQQLRFLNAGPRDVIDVHLTAVKVALRRSAERPTAALLEEARPLVLQLMGELLAIYRLEAVSTRHQSPREAL